MASQDENEPNNYYTEYSITLHIAGGISPCHKSRFFFKTPPHFWSTLSYQVHQKTAHPGLGTFFAKKATAWEDLGEGPRGLQSPFFSCIFKTFLYDPNHPNHPLSVGIIIYQSGFNFI